MMNGLRLLLADIHGITVDGLVWRHLQKQFEINASRLLTDCKKTVRALPAIIRPLYVRQIRLPMDSGHPIRNAMHQHIYTGK